MQKPAPAGGGPVGRDPRSLWRQLADAPGQVADQLRPRAFPVTGTMSPLLAWSVVATAFVAGFGDGLLNAIRYLRAGSLPSAATWTNLPQHLIAECGPVALLVVVTVMACRWLAPSSSLRWRGLRAEATAGGVWVALMSAAFVLVDLVSGWFGFEAVFPTSATTQPYVISQFTSSGAAGFGEEPLFTILIPLVLRAAGYRWWLVLLTSGLLRVSFHIYYGPGAIMLLLWSIGTVVLVQRTGCIWGVVLTHSAHDLIASWVRFTHGTLSSTVGVAGVLAQTALALFVVVRCSRAGLGDGRRRRGQHPQGT